MIFEAGKNPTASDLNEATEGVVGGVLRITDDATTSGATERAWATTAAIPLRANTIYEVRVDMRWTGSVIADQFATRIRDTNAAGTLRASSVPQPVATAGGGPYSLRNGYTFTTGASPTTRTFAATIVRIVGSGVGAAVTHSKIDVIRVGPAGVLSTV